MCEHRQAKDVLDRAMRRLTAACLDLVPTGSLRDLYNREVDRGLLPGDQDLLDKLQ